MKKIIFNFSVKFIFFSKKRSLSRSTYRYSLFMTPLKFDENSLKRVTDLRARSENQLCRDQQKNEIKQNKQTNK